MTSSWEPPVTVVPPVRSRKVALVRLPSIPLVGWANVFSVILMYTQFVLGPILVAWLSLPRNV